MNKYQEALDRMYDNYIYGAKQKEDSYFKLQELVDRATPMKPLSKRINHNGLKVGGCKCLYHIDNHRSTNTEVDETYDFCKKCGQALDWSDDE